MLEILDPKYSFTCDRCGKKRKFTAKDVEIVNGYPVLVNPVLVNVQFREDRSVFQRSIDKKGQVCKECYDEFWELANNFFDESNREPSSEEESDAPAADVVEVVRCKNCSHFVSQEYDRSPYCNHWYAGVDEDDFCSEGTTEEENDGRG